MLPKRLKAARLAAGLSQQKLGVLAGIDEATASARMNQYEKGVHLPDFSLMVRIADILDVPSAYFYAVEDELAKEILEYQKRRNT
ncbi:transcriptional regulator with XRE-family HTH domain [Serratia sp. BIGb0234]|uniref:helix-turn-helix domain-containing protein n=1 Tax=Serratia sp. BIGb0234 TaxID=2940614 RepID=UPI00216A7324|nr:helix-turn-helix transcriptional regulator [Serratia sp. BIGb0234]MCS4320895.1 transcriptional regulator with XRE-family HTH domain [Serratia sp. BIGb0234]